MTEAAYIGHKDKSLIIKKMSGIQIGNEQHEIDTVDDNFESIEIDNTARFEQFMKVMKNNPRAAEMSIRVIIDETVEDKPKVLDYEFFFREKEIMANKKLFGDKWFLMFIWNKILLINWYSYSLEFTYKSKIWVKGSSSSKP